jgi:hypothetical protein
MYEIVRNLHGNRSTAVSFLKNQQVGLGLI